MFNLFDIYNHAAFTPQRARARERERERERRCASNPVPVRERKKEQILTNHWGDSFKNTKKKKNR